MSQIFPGLTPAFVCSFIAWIIVFKLFVLFIFHNYDYSEKGSKRCKYLYLDFYFKTDFQFRSSFLNITLRSKIHEKCMFMKKS